MRSYAVNQPDETALRQILKQGGMPAIVLRLAWQAGLCREEIATLTWQQVSFADNRLELPNRQIPMEDDLRQCLWQLYLQNSRFSDRVILSEKRKNSMKPESISRLARIALNAAGQDQVQLMDLRHDWMGRQLENQDWAAVSRISGVEIATLQARFPQCAHLSPEQEQADEYKLWKVLEREGSSTAGLALWLVWQVGLHPTQAIALTWDNVDFNDRRLRFDGREFSLDDEFVELLEEAKQSRPPDLDPHVLLTSRSYKPIDLARLSRTTRAALIRGGIEHITLRSLRRDDIRGDEDSHLLDFVKRNGSISRRETMAELHLTKVAAQGRLKRLAAEGKLVLIGGKYYLPGAAVPKSQQEDTILNYLKEVEFAYRQDLATLLGVRPQQCGSILRRMLDDGKLMRTGQKYYLSKSESYE